MFSWFSAWISLDQGVYFGEKFGFDFYEYIDFLTRYSFTDIVSQFFNKKNHWVIEDMILCKF